jgi:hypothetical protein
MAVVQISRIQVRRGRKNDGIGVPQLSSGELAWAVDSQELFVGNGSVAEGAPYVGNTKILTEHDNLLDLATSYQFSSNDTSIVNSVPRSLQTKLDEYVSVLDFGAVPDGATDNVEAFERAFADLFQNADNKFKKKLFVPNGIYLFASNLRIPSTAIIEGENQNQTVLNISSNNILFVTEAGLEIGDFTSVNRPTNIKMSNMTVNRSTGRLVLSGIKNSSFDNLKFLGSYQLGDSVVDLESRSSAVYWENTLEGIKVDGIVFDKCFFQHLPLAVRSDQSITAETNVSFRNCEFEICETGIYVDGTLEQTNKWNIFDSSFTNIHSEAIKATAGRKFLISRNKFTNCGNGTSSASSPETAIISFGEYFGNIVSDCKFDRHLAAAVVASNAVDAIPEVLNANAVSLIDKNYTEIFLSDSFRPLAVFSSLSRYIIIEYTLNLGVHSRTGTIKIAITSDKDSVSITDEYFYTAESPTAPGGALMTNFEFSVDLRNNTGWDDSTLGDNPETLVLYYMNPLQDGQTGTISYSVSYGV